MSAVDDRRAQDRAWAGAMSRELGVNIAPPQSSEPHRSALVVTMPAHEPTMPPLREGQIHLGEANAGGPVGVDLAKLLEGRLLIQGNSGAGKSMLLRRLFEQTFGRVQQLLLDVDGEFSTLAECFDVPIVGFADAARVGGTAFALHLREHRYSAVLDLSDATSEDRLEFIADLVSGLIEAPEAHWHPLLVLVDEAQVLAPHYDPGDVETATRKRAIGALANLMGRGRKRGLAGLIATQRIAETAKAVVAKATNVVVGRTIFDRDLERAGALLGFTAGHAKALRTLADGEFLAIGPAIAGPRRIRFKAAAARSRHKGTAPAVDAPPAMTASDALTLIRAAPAAADPSPGRLDGRRRPSVRGRGFDAGEDAIIADGYREKLSVRHIAEKLEAAGFRRRSLGGISGRARDLGFASDKAYAAWSEAEDRILADGYGNPDLKIMDVVGRLAAGGYTRGRVAVQMRAITLGITRDRVNYWSDEEKRIAFAGLNAGKTNRDIIADLKAAGFSRGLTSVSKFAQKHNFDRSVDPWTPDEIAELHTLYAAKTPVKVIAEKLGKTITAIRARASNLGLKQRLGWSDEERQALIAAHAAGETLVQATGRIGRPYPNVGRMAMTLGLAFRKAPPGSTAPPTDAHEPQDRGGGRRAWRRNRRPWRVS